jgi:DNA-binding sugar fermentation-stimulating protein
MTTGQFVLQIVGITEGKLLSRPSKKYPFVDGLSDILILKDERELVAHTPSLDCDGLAEAGLDILVAPCPPDEFDDDIIDSMNGNAFTHTIFLSVFREINDRKNEPKPAPKPKKEKKKKVYIKNNEPVDATTTTVTKCESSDSSSEDDDEDNEQFIAINPKIAVEVMESAIEKHLMVALPPVKKFKRNIELKMEGKFDSVFSFVGFCTDDVPFIMEVQNVPYASYTHGARKKENKCKYRFNAKTAYFPGKCCTPASTAEMIKKINELTIIKTESVTRCILGYVIERTDIDRFEFSADNNEYRAAVRNAVEHGVLVVPLVVSWTKEGVAFYVTDELPVVFPAV